MKNTNSSTNSKSSPLSLIWRGYSSLKLWQRIFLGLILGVIVGLIFGPKASVLEPVGKLFINAIKLLVVPIVFASITVGVVSMGDTRAMGRIGVKTIFWFVVTMALAAFIGISIGTVMQPGADTEITSYSFTAKGEAALARIDSVKASQDVGTMVTSILPDNVVKAFSDNGAILQVILFAILMGVAIIRTGKRAEPVTKVLQSLSEIILELAQIVMQFAPFGVFALMATNAGQFGLDILTELAKVVFAIYLGCTIQLVVVYSVLLLFVARLNPLNFFRGMADAIVFAFSTSSSAATLLTNLRCAKKNLGVSERVADFILPLGATVNMNGLACYLGVVTVFAANLYGIHLSFFDYTVAVVTTILAAIGAAGVPGAGLMVMSLVLSAAGIPLEAIGLIAGVDSIIGMASTTTNVVGDTVTAVLVAKNEGELDVNVYNDESTVNATREEQRREGLMTE
jgi:Na+/H+-dicarboxylate symporter